MFGLAGRREARATAVLAAAEPGAVAAVEPVGIAAAGAEAIDTRTTVDLLEADLRRAAGRIEATGSETRARVAESSTILAGVRRQADDIVERTARARSDIETLAEGLSELHVTSEEIGRRAQASQSLVDDAGRLAEGAARSIDQLEEAIAEIQSVVSTITVVAGQTNLLALNATIEAARAGDAGRGFAVVASEVKALSVETRNATSEIGGTIARLRATAESNIEAVQRILHLIGEIGPVFGEVSQSVQMQIGTTAEIGRRATDTARFAEEVETRAREMSVGMARAEALGHDVETAAEAMNGVVAEANRHLVTVLRQVPGADRRRHHRWPVEISGRFEVAGRAGAVRTIDLSEGGCLVRPEAAVATFAVGTTGRLELAGIGTLAVRVVGAGRNGLHLAFAGTDDVAGARLAARIAAIEAEFAPLVERARQSAERLSALLQKAVERGELRLDDLFDTDYRALPGTSPVQFETRSLATLERLLAPVQEAVRREDERIVFCAAVDLNGWLPVHNAEYSKPQRPGETEWNIANSRNRRIYDDRTGLLAARNTRAFLVQSYLRDLGGDRPVPMKEIDVPIVVGGRAWGGLRTAYRL
jgi:methyl-accepting chemotaxis protein